MPTPLPGRYSAPSGSQAGGVLRHGLDLAVVHMRGDAAHHAVAIVAALTFAKSRELRGHVVGKLSGEPRELCGDAGAGGAVATFARGDSVRRIAAAPELLPNSGKLLVARRRGLLRLS